MKNSQSDRCNNWRLTRRDFLNIISGAIGFSLLPVWQFAEAVKKPEKFVPEYERSLSEVLIVYDQVSAPYLFKEITQVISHLPAGATIYFLCSPEKRRELEEQCKVYAIQGTRILECSDQDLWGDWGRDLFQSAWKNEIESIIVPYNKTTTRRAELNRGYKVLKGIISENRRLEQAPLAFEGGNILYDRIDGKRTIFVGNTALLETIELYRVWFGQSLSFLAAQELFKKIFNVDQVIPIGRFNEHKQPLRQAHFLFHIDMAMTILREGVACICEMDWNESLIPRLKEQLEAEDEWEQKVVKEIKAEGIDNFPVNPQLRLLSERLREETAHLYEAQAELKAIKKQMKSLGYVMHSLQTDWKHLRRFQAYSNVIVSKDRLIMPVFPTDEGVHARTLPYRPGRNIAQILTHHLPKEFSMTGLNLRNFETYTRLAGGVRVVKDYFYLACGNLHCILGVLS